MLIVQEDSHLNYIKHFLHFAFHCATSAVLPFATRNKGGLSEELKPSKLNAVTNVAWPNATLKIV